MDGGGEIGRSGGAGGGGGGLEKQKYLKCFAYRE